MNQLLPPRLPQPIGQIIADLEAGLSLIDANWIDGIYLTGSIALGDFYPAKSDIDFLILCREFPTNERIVQLEKLHRTIQSTYKQPLFNGAYITGENLKASNLPTGQVLNFHEGKLTSGLFEMGTIALYELKTIACAVTGTPTDHLPIDIQLDQVKDFMHENINAYWQNWINRHASFTNRRILMILLPLLTEWVVLGVARQFYTLQTGKIGSKLQGGVYCLDVVPDPYRATIQQALQIRQDNPAWFCPSFGTPYYIAPSLKRAAHTIDCVNYLIELFNNVYAEQKHQRTDE